MRIKSKIYDSCCLSPFGSGDSGDFGAKQTATPHIRRRDESEPVLLIRHPLGQIVVNGLGFNTEFKTFISFAVIKMLSDKFKTPSAEQESEQLLHDGLILRQRKTKHENSKV